MAISVTPNLTTVSTCDSTTGWAGGIAQFVLDTNVPIQGTGCLAAWINNTTSAIQYYTFTAVNMAAAGHHVYIRMLVQNGQADTKANGGYRIVLYTDASNYATWYVGGSDTVESGWVLFVVDPSSTPTSQVGTFDPTSVTRIGVQFKIVTAGRKWLGSYVYNVFWDIVRYGTGLTITSGATDAITLEDIYQIDFNSTNKYGVVLKQAGAYILNGKLTFGSASSGSIDFNMTDEVLLCPNIPEVGDNFNAIEVLGNSAGTSNFEVSGSFIKANNKKITINLDNDNLDTVEILGSSITNGSLTFRTGQDIQNNVFSGCGQLIVGLATFIGNTVKETISTVAALLYPTTTTNIHDNLYIDNTTGAGVELDTAQTYTFNGEEFSGNTYDINNTSGGSVVVNATNGSNPSTYLGTVTINNAVSLTLENLVAGTEVTILRAGTLTVEANTASSSTSFTYTYNYPTGFNVDISLINPGYEALWLSNIVLSSSASSIPVSQQVDRNFVP